MLCLLLQIPLIVYADYFTPSSKVSESKYVLAPQSIFNNLSKDKFMDLFNRLFSFLAKKAGSSTAPDNIFFKQFVEGDIDVGMESIPIRKKGYIDFIEKVELVMQKDVVVIRLGEKGEMVIEKELERGFLNERIKSLIKTLFRVLSMRAQSVYKEFLKEVRFRISENVFNLAGIDRDEAGIYEIVIDKVIFDLPDVDIYPFMTLAMNHEFNHPQLHEELTGHVYDPLIREMAVLLADLDVFERMNEGNKGEVRRTLSLLANKKYNTKPYLNFLDSVDKGVKERIRAAYLLATDESVNPRLSWRINALLENSVEVDETEVIIDFKKAIEDYDYNNIDMIFDEPIKVADILEDVFEQPLICFRDGYLPDIFSSIDLKKQEFGGIVDVDLDSAILDEVIPEMTIVGGNEIRIKLEEILASSDFDMKLKSHAARALLLLSSNRSLPMIRNPFFGRAIVDYLRRVREKKEIVFSKELYDDVSFKIMLLGNVRVSSPDLYREIRSELVWWYLYSDSAAWGLDSDDRQKYDEEKNVQQSVARKMSKLAARSIENIRNNLCDYLGESKVTKRNWKRKNEYITVSNDPINKKSDDEKLIKSVRKQHGYVNDKSARKEIIEDVKASKFVKRTVLKVLEDSLFVREALFVINGVLVKEEDIQKVYISYFARGTQKNNYLARVETKDGKSYKFLINVINPRIFTGEIYKDGFKEGCIEKEKMYLKLIGNPNVETLGCERKQDDICIWTEELLDGVTMHEYVKKHSKLPPEEFRRFWKDIVRKHVEIQFSLFEKSARKLANNDVNPYNTTWKDGKGKINDIGNIMPDANLARLIAIICGRMQELEEMFPTLQNSAEMTDICDGVLDAIGEVKGNQLLKEYVDGDQSPQLIMPITFRGRDIREEVKNYLKSDVYKYIPKEVQRPATDAEIEISMGLPKAVNFVVYVKRGLYKLDQSPWIWTCLNLKELEIKGMDRPMYKACKDIYEAMRKDYSLSCPENHNVLNALVDSVSVKYNLDQSEVKQLRSSVSYGEAIYQISTDLFGRTLEKNKIKHEKYKKEIGLLSELVVKLALDPSKAVSLLLKLQGDDKIIEMFKKLTDRQDKSLLDPMQLVLSILGQLTELDLIARENLIDLFRYMPLEDQIKAAQFSYPEILEDLITKDYKLFADILNGMSEDIVVMIVPQLTFKIIPAKNITVEETAYIFKELDLNIVIDMILGLTGSRNMEFLWGSLWREWIHDRITKTEYYEQELHPMVGHLIDEVWKIDVNKAVMITQTLINGLDEDYSIGNSFLGRRELIKGNMQRYNDLILVLSSLSREILLNTFRRMYKTDRDQIIVFGKMLRSAGYKAQFDRILNILNSDERLRGMYVELLLEDGIKEKSLEEETAVEVDLAA